MATIAQEYIQEGIEQGLEQGMDYVPGEPEDLNNTVKYLPL